jgi:hypothetical protein
VRALAGERQSPNTLFVTGDVCLAGDERQLWNELASRSPPRGTAGIGASTSFEHGLATNRSPPDLAPFTDFAVVRRTAADESPDDPSGRGRRTTLRPLILFCTHIGPRRLNRPNFTRWRDVIGEMLFLCSAEGRFFVPAC